MHTESWLWNKRDSAGHAFADFGKQSKCDAATETDAGNPSTEGRGRSDRKKPIALHVPGKLDWDAKNMRFTNSPEANKFVKPMLRKGWEPKV